MQDLPAEQSLASKIQFNQLSYSENAKEDIPGWKIERGWSFVK